MVTQERVAEKADWSETTDSEIQQTQEAIGSEKPQKWGWTREEYHRAGELGLFRPDARLELLNGEIYKKMSPQSNRHASSIAASAETLRESLGAGFHVREEKPIVLSDRTELEPDIVIMRGSARRNQRHPTAETALLVMEVSVSTLDFDRTDKAEAYARSGVADYWVLNVRGRCLEVRRDPGPLPDGQFGYHSLQILLEDGEIAPLALPDVKIKVTDLLPTLLQGESEEQAG